MNLGFNSREEGEKNEETILGRTKYMQAVNPFMPTGAFNICCPRDCVLGIMGEPRVPSLNPSESIVL